MAALADVVVVDMQDEVYLDMFGKVREENDILRKQQDDPGMMWENLCKSMKKKLLGK